MVACPGCGNAEATWRCRWCMTDKLQALCAKTAQSMAGPRPPLRNQRKAA